MGKKCFLLFFVIFLCLVQTGSTLQLSLAQPPAPAEDNSLKQVGAFFIELNAKRLAEKLKGEGLEVEIREGTTQDNKTIYRVFAGGHKKSSDVTRPSSELKQVGAFFIELNAERFAEKLKGEGLEVEIREGTTQDNETIYRVFAGKHADSPEEIASAQGIKQDIPHGEVPEAGETGGAAEGVVETAETKLRETVFLHDNEQIAAFKIFRTDADAEAFAEQLRQKGFKVEIHETQTKDNGKLYTVFAERPKTLTEMPGAGKAGEAQEIVEKDATEAQEVLPSGQMATLRNFQTEADAEAFAKQLRSEGYNVTVNKPETEEAPYTVYAERPKESVLVPEPTLEEQKVVVQEEVAVKERPAIEEIPPVETQEPSEVAEVAAVVELESAKTEAVAGKEIPAVEEVPSEETREPTEVTAVAAAEDLKAAEAEAVPEGEGPVLQKEQTMELQEASQPEEMYYQVPEEASLQEPSLEAEEVETTKRDGIKSKDIFGRKRGYIHPFLSVTGYWTDNVFNQPVDEKSDFVTVLTPGVWFAVPGINQKLLSMNSSNISPGGYRLSRPSENFFRRYQVYLLYAADIEVFSKYRSQDFTGHRIEGLFQYNLRGGLTFEFVDQYLISHDIIGTGIRTADELDEYHTNLANPRLIYNPGKKWWFMVDYTNFYVKYGENRNDFRQRNDNAVSAYIFYRLRPKVSAFAQYEYIDINYREDVLSNSDEHNVYGGVAWDITAKSKGSFKAGYGTKDFADNTIDKANNFRLELQLNHRFTPKTHITLNAWRRTDETNISTTDYILAHGIEFGYNQQFTGRLIGNVRFAYMNDHYKGDLTYDGLTQERKDQYYIGTASLFYRFREWLGAGIGYTWTKRDSNFPSFEYTNNMIFFNLNFTGAF